MPLACHDYNRLQYNMLFIVGIFVKHLRERAFTLDVRPRRGHTPYLLTDVPPQSISSPDTIPRVDRRPADIVGQVPIMYINSYLLVITDVHSIK